MSTGGHALRRNPFRSTAVADTALIGRDPNGVETNVDTAAQQRVLAPLRAYLAGEDGHRGNGTTIVVSGDYGTGKTHLLVRMVDEALAAIGEPGRALYVVAGEDGFLALFRNFLKAVTKDELVRQVSQYYADAVQAELAANDVPHAGLAGRADTSEVEREYDVLSSVVNRRVHENLARVTDNADFTTALSLLMRDKRLADPVWEWLNGAEPPVALRNRRVQHRIDNDLAALDALGVLALVLGGRDQKFVLAVDEMSDIFARSDTPRERLMEAFRVLLETAKRSGACFILCGLPDLMESLSPKVRERVGVHVELGGFTENDIIEFILRSHERTFGERRFAPFAEHAQRTIRDFTRGNPRQVVRLLHRAFALAGAGHPDAGPTELPEITHDVLYQAASLLTPPTFDTVVDEIRMVAAQHGWPIRQEQTLALDPHAWAEFRVESGHRDGDFAVLVARSLLSDTEIRRFVDWVAAVRGTEENRPIALVTVGTPSNSALVAVRQVLHAEPIVRRTTFQADLTAALSAGPVPVHPGQGALAHVSRTLDEIKAMLATGAHGRELNPRAIAQEIAAYLAPARPEPRADELPDPVADLFTLAEDRLSALLAIEPRVRAAFDRGGYDSAAAFRSRFFEPAARQAIGAAAVMGVFLHGFRVRLARWFHESGDDHALAAICETYQAMEDWVPLSDLAPLAAVVDAPVPAIGASTAVEQAIGTLTGFAAKVRDAALDAASERA
ncbi:hypothetical protein [Actinokineospora fastidiosa]|uniref:AAA+ ATPase domain-containing protein n=1 Tax=Actinokineospora fastidiosa TaxID=1816 RepID=A0A918LHY7_9PSEU|nr:hypothetical protein [Actinokineospora fastidiosa]GGS52098.1 hypothetical protein GCM10010171_53950 [Actinokineospora fastidiosa]